MFDSELLNKRVSLSVEAIVKFFFIQFRNYGDIGVPVKGMLRVETVPIFSPSDVSLQDRIWLPSLPVLFIVGPRIAATLCVRFLRLKPLVSRPVSRTDQPRGILECLMRSGTPFRLNEKDGTFHPGWARWISVFPYLLLDATFERSISASLLRLKPFEDKPKGLAPNRSFWKLSLAIAEKPLP